MTLKPAAKPCKNSGVQQYFITEMNTYDINKKEGYADLRITNHKLKALPEKLLTVISPLRWIKLEEAKLWPGGASGTIILNNKRFPLTYAWRGLSTWRSKKETVLGWTVRINITSAPKFIEKFFESISLSENGPIRTQVTPKEWLKARNFKNYEAYKKYLLKLNKDIIAQVKEFDALPKTKKKEQHASHKKHIEFFRGMIQTSKQIDTQIAKFKNKKLVTLDNYIFHHVTAINTWELKREKS